MLMKRFFIIISFVLLGIGFVSCDKTIDTSVSLSGTEWVENYGSKSTVKLSFTNIEFSLTYTVKEKTENWLPGEGYRIKGSYVYEYPVATLYSRTIELLFNGEVEGVDTYKDEFNAVVVDDVLSMYRGNEAAGTL